MYRAIEQIGRIRKQRSKSRNYSLIITLRITINEDKYIVTIKIMNEV